MARVFVGTRVSVLGRVMAVFLALLICGGPTLRTEAAPIALSNGMVFDPVYYAEENPDVVAAVGTDAVALYQHYIYSGAAEGRLPYAGATEEDLAQAVAIMRQLTGQSSSEQGAGTVATGSSGQTVAQSGAQASGGVTALERYYAQKRLEVFSALVVNGRTIEDGRVTSSSDGYVRVEYPGGVLTLRGSGITVATDASAYFDAAAYAAANPDVAAVYGTDKGALWQQYESQGVYQGRVASGTTSLSNAKLQLIQVVQQLVKPGMSESEMVQAVHDWIVNYTSYDQTSADASQTIEGLVYNRTAVCAAYSKTFAYMMCLLGIPCETIGGIANGGSHAWNRVFIGGQWYYVDVTWDDPIYRYDGVRREVLRHDYFLISEAQMSLDHVAQSYNQYY